MDCVGLRSSLSMIEKGISLYWEMGEKEGVVLFVEEVLRRGIPYASEDKEGHKGGSTGYLAWKMMVRFQTTKIQMLPSNSKLFSWETYDEDVSSLSESSKITASGLLEQLNATRDTSDYLWYITSSQQLKSYCFLVCMPHNIDISSSESFLRGGNKPNISVHSAGHAVHVFINGQFLGSAFGTSEDRSCTFNGPVNLCVGTNKIALLSVAVGLPNVGFHC